MLMRGDIKLELQKIASKMHKFAKKNGTDSKSLSRGLQLTLFYRKDDIVLKMSRDKVSPSDTEIEVCQKAFFGNVEINNREENSNIIYIAVARKYATKPIGTIVQFSVEQLKQVGFSSSDCKAVATLEHALQTGHYPQEPYQPIGKPYMIGFAKVTRLYFEYLNQQVFGKADERCPNVGSIKRGLLELVGILQGKGELPKRQLSEVVQSEGLAVAPAIQEPDQQEKELDELLAQLKPHRRHTIEDARRKGVPLKALVHAAALFLSDDMDDWTVANDTIYSFTSPFGFRWKKVENSA